VQLGNGQAAATAICHSVVASVRKIRSADRKMRWRSRVSQPRQFALSGALRVEWKPARLRGELIGWVVITWDRRAFNLIAGRPGHRAEILRSRNRCRSPSPSAAWHSKRRALHQITTPPERRRLGAGGGSSCDPQSGPEEEAQGTLEQPQPSLICADQGDRARARVVFRRIPHFRQRHRQIATA